MGVLLIYLPFSEEVHHLSYSTQVGTPSKKADITPEILYGKILGIPDLESGIPGGHVPDLTKNDVTTGGCKYSWFTTVSNLEKQCSPDCVYSVNMYM